MSEVNSGGRHPASHAGDPGIRYRSSGESAPKIQCYYIYHLNSNLVGSVVIKTTF